MTRREALEALLAGTGIVPLVPALARCVAPNKYLPPHMYVLNIDTGTAHGTHWPEELPSGRYIPWKGNPPSAEELRHLRYAMRSHVPFGTQPGEFVVSPR